MEVWSFVLFFLSLLHYSTFCTSSRQDDALKRVWDAKLEKNGRIDTNLYHEVAEFDDSRLLVLPQEGLKEGDKIRKLPGQPRVNFSQYGGYVTVDHIAGRALYYYLVEAHHSKEVKPLLLWLNGGPGCSSLAFGAMEELGPFRVRSDGKTLYRNLYSWNQVANVLFLETPAGVGFSYSNTTSDYDRSGDKMTAEDNYVFLRNWLLRFPEYKTRDFYIAGESYAGHYVPQLAQKILRHNKIANKTIIPLKGVIIGNALIHDETNEMAIYDFFWGHSVISDDTISKIHRFCDFSKRITSECYKARREVHFSTRMDMYSIYSPTCHSDNVTVTPKKASLKYDPCGDIYVTAYLNSPEVQRALHANLTKLSHTYKGCSELVDPWRDSPDTILPILRELMENKLRVWLFSGDTDGVLPVMTTTFALNKLKLSLILAYHPWMLDEEVGGYSMIYKGQLTFATVRGAGHQVPSFEPKRALALITHFLDGTPL